MMSKPLIRRPTVVTIPDLVDWLEGALPAFAGGWSADQGMRIEAYVEQGTYVIRAELPGIDPSKDLELTVASGILTMHAERVERTDGKHHSEFRYGSTHRSVRLPVGTEENEIKAAYRDGILTVTAPLHEDKHESRKISVPAGDRLPVAREACHELGALAPVGRLDGSAMRAEDRLHDGRAQHRRPVARERPGSARVKRSKRCPLDAIGTPGPSVGHARLDVGGTGVQTHHQGRRRMASTAETVRGRRGREAAHDGAVQPHQPNEPGRLPADAGQDERRPGPHAMAPQP
jgi:HSP20 family molecular chaperone IbpA